MLSRWRFWLVLVLLAGGAGLATLGTGDSRVGLGSLRSLWSDGLRDVDQVGMRLTRLTDAEEMKIGADLAGRFPAEDEAASAYVTDVARSMLPYLRRKGIRYRFHVIESPQINAFALPGGEIFVNSALLGFVESEAELAAVVGHEMAHVDLRHCVEHYQYQVKLGGLAELAHRLATMGFSPDQELDADADGQRMSAEAGYDPSAAAALFERMKEKFHEPTRTAAKTPAGEVAGALSEALGAWFRTHPPSEERAQRLARHRAAGRVYTGRRNLRERIARSGREYPEEFH
jgi:predicted Zn-dependent protease